MNKMIAFFEIPADDFSRAVTFYETILNVKTSSFECDTEKMAFFPDEDDRSPGAISWTADFKPSSNGVLISLNVENMENTISLIENNGGTMIISKTKIEAERRGYFAVFIDSEGNRIGLYSDK